MSAPIITVAIDTAPLLRAVPRILAFGRRTMQEQCVTSAVYICRRAQKLTPAADIGRIDAQMQATASPAILASGKRSRDKKRQHETITLAGGRRNRAMMRVLARMHPGSRYNEKTGGRWFTPLPLGNGRFTGPQGRRDFWDIIEEKAERMVKAKHSSTNFLQTGWRAAIMLGIASPFFRGNSGGESRGQMQAHPNPLYRKNTQLGDLTIDISGEDCRVVASNEVGENVGRSNPTLAALHRSYLIRFGVPAANQAIAEEVAGIDALVEKRLIEGMKVKFPELLS